MTSNVSRPVPGARLPADFAGRVIGRVEEIEHQRSIRRRMLATTAVLSLSLAAVLTWQYPLISSPRSSIAQSAPADSAFAKSTLPGPEPAYPVVQEQPVVDLTLPDGYLVTNFVNSSGESSWHSYDSWWGSNL